MKESQHTEWKLTWRDEFLRWICGFANAEGGTLVLGRDDKGKPVGVDNSKKLLEDLPNKIRDVLGILVDVRLVHEAKKDLIEIHVASYPSPISYKGEYHYRTGSTKQELKGASLERFLLRKRGRHWDEAPEPSFTTRACSAAAFRLFKKRASRSGRMDPAVLRDRREVVLDNLELRGRHGYKRAACLLFAERPERYVGGASIKIGFFKSDEELRFQNEVRGSLFEQVEETLQLLHTKYLKAYISYEGLHRRETFLFPEAALREALLNAVVHKDYGSAVPIQISVYDDHLVVWNPGVLPDDWTMKRLLGKHPSRPFNPLIANAFFCAGYIEAWGTGIGRIMRACQEHRLPPPVFDFGMSGLMVTLWADPARVAAARDQGEGTTQETGPITSPMTSPIAAKEAIQERIVALLRAEPSTTLKALALTLGLSRNGLKYHLGKLKSGGRVRRHGSAKTGLWVVEAAREPGDGTTQETPATTPIDPLIRPINPLITTPETDQERIVTMLRAQPFLTQKTLAQALGLTFDSVKHHLQHLKAVGRVRREGSRKAGRWEVLG